MRCRKLHEVMVMILTLSRISHPSISTDFQMVNEATKEKGFPAITLFCLFVCGAEARMQLIIPSCCSRCSAS